MSAEESQSDVVEPEPEAEADDVAVDETSTAAEPSVATPRSSWQRIMAFIVLPVAAVLLAAGAGYLKWQEYRRDADRAAAAESVEAARDITPAILSYRAETVEKDLNAVRDRLTGDFLNSYTKLINDVVIPGAKQQKISAAADVAAAASVSATADHAVVLVFVDQKTTVGAPSDKNVPTATASSIRVTLDKVAGRWLVSGFDPV